MKCCLVLPSCVLLLCTLTAFVSSGTDNEEPEGEIRVDEFSGGITLSCSGNFRVTKPDTTSEKQSTLAYKDENSGEYKCVQGDKEKSKIFVKFRTCDNCIELDVQFIIAIVVGNLIATAGICVSIYLVASVVPMHAAASNDKKFDRKQPGPQDHYQGLEFKSPKDVYDKLDNRR